MITVSPFFSIYLLCCALFSSLQTHIIFFLFHVLSYYYYYETKTPTFSYENLSFLNNQKAKSNSNKQNQQK